jgi:AMMECR1 domain-containing protein
VDGLIIEDAGCRSLFLPSVWEEVPDPRQFVALLKLKAGLPAEYFSPRFTAQRFRSIEVKGEMDSGTTLGVANEMGWTVLGAGVSPSRRSRR